MVGAYVIFPINGRINTTIIVISLAVDLKDLKYELAKQPASIVNLIITRKKFILL